MNSEQGIQGTISCHIVGFTNARVRASEKDLLVSKYSFERLKLSHSRTGNLPLFINQCPSVLTKFPISKSGLGL